MVYTEQALVEKLNRINGTELSIQTLSYWIICDSHKKHYAQSVKIWEKELHKAKKEKKLIFIYLANDILQTSRKKGSEFIKEFGKVIKSAILHVYREGDSQTQKSLVKTLNVWIERKVYPAAFIEDIKVSMNENDNQVTASFPPLNSPTTTNPLIDSIRKVESNDIANDLMEEKYSSLNTSLFSDTQKLNTDPIQYSSELEDACYFLSQYHKQLEDDINRRQILFQSLMDHAEKQESIIQKHKTKLQDINSKLLLAEKAKSEIQSQLDSTQHDLYSPHTANEPNTDDDIHNAKRLKVTDSLNSDTTVSQTNYNTNWMSIPGLPLSSFPSMFPIQGFPAQSLPFPIADPNSAQFPNWTLPSSNFKTT